MFKNVARRGLFNRLVSAGAHPYHAASIVLAVYPDKREPLEGEYAGVRPKLASDYTEQFIDQGLTLDELFDRLFGCTVDTYFQAA